MSNGQEINILAILGQFALKELSLRNHASVGDMSFFENDISPP